jgi:hypothetical protein
MHYGKSKQAVNYGLENLQKQRELATDDVEKADIQKQIDFLFFGSTKRKLTRKERRRQKRRERQKMREEEY